MHCFSLTVAYLGEAIGLNPGYLKLRKIRAAQSIARTVSIQTFIEYYINLLAPCGHKYFGSKVVLHPLFVPPP